ncbi:MAG: response regulator transcription factor [Gemmatimonadota bacterium]
MSRRETEILRCIMRGRTGSQIAYSLMISPHTVRAHVRNIYLRLGVHSRVELIRRVLVFDE